MNTYSGHTVDLLNPDPDTIVIEDIAHHLSQLNRFVGATTFPYSVAAHSIYVSHLVSPEAALDGLMHDAPETYLCDVHSPFKQLLLEYKVFEQRFWEVIADKFGCSKELPSEVKWRDKEAYVKERIELINKPFEEDHDYEDFIDIPVPDRPLSCRAEYLVEKDFLKRFKELSK